MKRFICGIFVAIGLLCIIFPGQITKALPYVLGGAMAAAGVVYGVAYFRNREAWAEHSAELADGLILLVVGILCMVHGADSIGPMGVTWAIIGLRKASKSLSKIIQSRDRGITFYTSLVEFFARLSFSVVLLFYPTEKFKNHVVLLGFELLAVSIQITKRNSLALDVEVYWG